MPRIDKLEPRYKHSKQRDRILELLRGTDTHPTADWVYSQLKPEIPSLSLGTVYRNLNILLDQGKILRIENGSTYDRYDANLDPHYHFLCKACHQILDIKMPQNKQLDATVEKLTGFHVDDHRIDFIGVCKDCLSR